MITHINFLLYVGKVTHFHPIICNFTNSFNMFCEIRKILRFFFELLKLFLIFAPKSQYIEIMTQQEIGNVTILDTLGLKIEVNIK